jgi:hypothetical protein
MAAAAAVVVAAALSVVAVDAVDVPSRFRKAVTSLPAGTMATTSQPSADFSVSFAASEEAS